jgi:hypothetical protein
MAPSVDTSARGSINKHYTTEPPHPLLDPLAIRPFRKAVLEKHEDMEKRNGGGGDH